jgi:hypothetical protein
MVRKLLCVQWDKVRKKAVFSSYLIEHKEFSYLISLNTKQFSHLISLNTKQFSHFISLNTKQFSHHI